jgi:hypothetical protein
VASCAVHVTQPLLCSKKATETLNAPPNTLQTLAPKESSRKKSVPFTDTFANGTPKKFKPRPVLVEWLDAYQVGYWQDGNDDLECEPTLVYTLGWLMKKSKAAIYLAQSLAEDNHGNVIVIPTNMIKRITNVALPEMLSK